MFVVGSSRQEGESRTRRWHETIRSAKRASHCADTHMSCDSAQQRARYLLDEKMSEYVGGHKLQEDRQGQWAMSVNGPWRIGFEFRGGEAFDVEIVDYHRG